MIAHDARTERARTSSRRRRSAPRSRVLRGVAELVLTAGVLSLFFTAYLLWGEPALVSETQQKLDGDLGRMWRSPDSPESQAPHPSAGAPPVLEEGMPFARLAIPTLGQHWTVVEGVSPAALRTAPGHYPSTASPGEIGNFAVAGHRSSALFLDLDRVANGDVITVETRDSVFTYTVYREEVVLPSDLLPIAPNPDARYAGPPRALLTLTTCEPKWDNSHRLIIHAELTRVRDKP
jgi:sortase A